MMLRFFAGFNGNIAPYEAFCQLAAQNNGIFCFGVTLQRTQPYSWCPNAHKLAAYHIVNAAFLVVDIDARRVPENVSNDQKHQQENARGADNYDLLSQSYTEGTQSAFLVGILAVLGVLLGCALLVVLNLSAYEVQQQRLSLLLTLGVSPKKLVCSYAKRVIPVIVGTTLIVNILVSVAVSHIVPIQSILDLIRIHTDGRVFEFHRPVGSQILVSILLMGFWLGAALLPVFSFIRKKASKGDIL